MKQVLFIHGQGFWSGTVEQALCEDYEVTRLAVDSSYLILERKSLDIVLVEAMVTGSLAFTRKMAPHLKSTLTVFLSEKLELGQLSAAFSAGYDEYLSLPMEPLELRLRLQARSKEKSAPVSHECVWRGALRMAVPQQRVVEVQAQGERDLELTPNEFRILYALTSRERHTLSRDQILREAWGEGLHVESRTVDKHICSLRRKLGSYARALVSVPGKGYLFDSRLAQSQTAASPAPYLNTSI